MEQPINHDEAARQDSNETPAVGLTTPVADSVGKENKPNENGANRGNNGGDFKKWIDHLWSRDPDRQLELILALSIAFFSLCQLVVTILNNVSTSAQVDKMIVSAGSIKDSAGEIKNAGWVFSGAAQGINNAGWNAVGRLQDQANQVGRSANAAENAVRVTQEQMRLDERAWVGFTDATVTLSTTSPIKAETQTHILGKSPAIDIVTKTGMRFDTPDRVLQLEDIILNPKEIPNGTAFPGGQFPVRSTGVDPISDQEKAVIDAVTKKTIVLYFFGETRYRDIFKTEHWTHFCYLIISAESKEISPCKIYNDSDADKDQSAHR